jgi:hypothetical protein
MPEPTTKTETVTANGVQRGDVIRVGGIPHTVTNLRNIGLTRTLLQFADGNTYLLDHSHTIEVTRLPPVPEDSLPAAGRRTP